MWRLRIVMSMALAACLAPAQTTRPPDEEAIRIARKLDNLYRSKSSYSEVEMEIVTPNWSRTLGMKFWTVGTDKTFIRVLEPRKDRGMGTLRIGSEMWNYFPRIDKVMKIPPSMMMSSWMGSDFNNDDLVKEFTFVRDYDFRLIRPEDSSPGLLYLEARPKEGVPVVWSRIVGAVHTQDLMPIWERYYDGKDMLMRTITFSDVKAFGGRSVPTSLELVPAKEAGHKTILRYKAIEFDHAVSGDIMTLRHLQVWQ